MKIKTKFKKQKVVFGIGGRCCECYNQTKDSVYIDDLPCYCCDSCQKKLGLKEYSKEVVGKCSKCSIDCHEDDCGWSSDKDGNEALLCFTCMR